MKKRIYIIISSVLLLLLSGCDAILDSVYPPDINNSINVSLSLDGNLDSSYDYVTIQLIPIDDESKLDMSLKITERIRKSEFIEYTFSLLPANSYRAFAFIDKDEDKIADWDEPSTELWNESNYSQPGLFDFRFNEDDLKYSAVGWIS